MTIIQYEDANNKLISSGDYYVGKEQIVVFKRSCLGIPFVNTWTFVPHKGYRFDRTESLMRHNISAMDFSKNIIDDPFEEL